MAHISRELVIRLRRGSLGDTRVEGGAKITTSNFFNLTLETALDEWSSDGDNTFSTAPKKECADSRLTAVESAREQVWA